MPGHYPWFQPRRKSLFDGSDFTYLRDVKKIQLSLLPQQHDQDPVDDGNDNDAAPTTELPLPPLSLGLPGLGHTLDFILKGPAFVEDVRGRLKSGVFTVSVLERRSLCA